MSAEHLQLLQALGLTAALFTIFASLSLLAWRFFHRQLTLWSRQSQSNFDDLLLAALRTPGKVFLLSASLGASLKLSPTLGSIQEPLLLSVKLVSIISLIWSLGRIAHVFIHSDQLSPNFSESNRLLLKTIAKFVIYSIGLLVIMDTLGISITPLLASLGVGSVAVALAAQDTLSNLFSGFYILLDRPFRIGDCIKLDSGVEGIVTKIGWRSTHIRLFANSVAILPNSKIASAMITNYDFPESEISVTIPVSASYESDLQHVEQVALEVAFLVQNTVPFGAKSTPPTMVFTQFADSGINFNVILRAERFTDSNRLRHEFIKALHARFNQEGISIPYPQSVVHWPNQRPPS